MNDKEIRAAVSAVQKKKYAIDVLISAKENGLTTLGYAWQQIGKPDLTRQAVRKVIDWLVSPPQYLNLPALLERQQPRLFGQSGRPENLYVLLEDGAVILNELILSETVKAPQIRDPWDLTHRYIILKVAQLAREEDLDVKIEHNFKHPVQEVRADFYAEPPGLRIVMEMEQKLLRKNFKRAPEKYIHWAKYIQAAAPDEIWRIYIVLNVRNRNLSTVIRYWQEALDKAVKEFGELPFAVFYITVNELLALDSFMDGLLQANLLEETELDVELPPIFLGEEDDGDVQAEHPHYIDEERYVEFQDALDALLEAPPEQALEALKELAKQIYVASYYPNSPSLKAAVFPWASIWLMCRYLEHPDMASVKADLTRELTRITKRSPGMIMLRETVTSLLWDVLLYRHGLGRGGILRVVFQVPDFQDNSSDFRVDVRIDTDLRSALTDDAMALRWFFTSIYLYRRHLGLVDEKKK